MTEHDIEMQPVKSSNVKAVGYHPESKTLRVEFHNGGVYDYQGIPPEEHTALMDSKSIGNHLHTRIKGKYGYQRAG